MKTQFITDSEGDKVAVIIPVDEYEILMDDLSDLAAVAERRGDVAVSFEEVKRKLIADGLLPS